MTDNIAVTLDKAYYVRSKISNYPLSHNILPVPNGMSAVIFKNNEDIDEYYKIREIEDFDNFEILPVISFYDFIEGPLFLTKKNNQINYHYYQKNNSTYKNSNEQPFLFNNR